MNSTEQTPRVWLVIGDKLGDNAQVEMIAGALGIPFEIRRVLPKQQYVLGKPRFRASLYHLDMQRSDRLQPPWPDIVFTVGRRPSMAALWIREQAGPGTRLVLVGRPRRWIERFDLVISPPQFRLPMLPNVMRLQFPAMRPDRQRIADETGDWRPRMETLPRPLVAVLVGGPTRPMRFDRDTARQLVQRAAEIANGGTLFVTTSRRTPPAVVKTLRELLPQDAQLFVWDADSKENPYHALLGHADSFVVTGDSISMMVEVACVGKPLYIFQLPESAIGRLWKRIQAVLLPDTPRAGGLPHLGRVLYNLGVLGFPRSLTSFHEYLVAQGFAALAGSGTAPAGAREIPDDLAAARERILGLLDRPGNIGN